MYISDHVYIWYLSCLVGVYWRKDLVWSQHDFRKDLEILPLARLVKMATKSIWLTGTSLPQTSMSTATSQRSLEMRLTESHAEALSLAPAGAAASPIFRGAITAMWCGKCLCCVNLDNPIWCLNMILSSFQNTENIVYRYLHTYIHIYIYIHIYSFFHLFIYL